MTGFLKTLLSLSLSGSLLILLLLAGRPLFRGRLSRRCQYLLWLAAALRLLLPFSPENNLMNALFRQQPPAAQAETDPMEPDPAPAYDLQKEPDWLALPQSLLFPGYLQREGPPILRRTKGEQPVPALPDRPLSIAQPEETPAQSLPRQPAASSPEPPAESGLQKWPALLTGLWLAGFLCAASLRLWAHRRFCRRLAAGLTAPPQQALETAEQLRRQMNLPYPVALWASPDLASPMLARLGRPCVILPAEPVSPNRLRPVLLHELAHYQRRDLASKGLLQLALCVHWFNPLVWRMVRVAQQDCELACDETALAYLPPEQRLAYGDALLDFSSRAAATAGAVSLSADARLLQQRLEAILRFRQSGKRTLVRSAAALTALSCAALYAGVYADPPAQPQAEQPAPQALSSSPRRSGSATLASPTIFYENNFLFTLSPCADPDQWEGSRKRASYTLAFTQDSLPWRYDAGLINGVDKALSGSAAQAALLESVAGPYTESADQLAWKFYQADAPDQFGPTAAKASAAAKKQLALQAYQDRRLEFFSLAVLTLDSQTCRQLALQALEDREASYLYPLAPLLEEATCFDLADQAARQSCYGCFMPLFERLGDQNKLLMGRQAIENQDALRFSMMRGRLTDGQRVQLAQVAYDANDLELFSLAVSRLSFQQRQQFLSRAYADDRMDFFKALQSS